MFLNDHPSLNWTESSLLNFYLSRTGAFGMIWRCVKGIYTGSSKELPVSLFHFIYLIQNIWLILIQFDTLLAGFRICWWHPSPKSKTPSPLEKPVVLGTILNCICLTCILKSYPRLIWSFSTSVNLESAEYNFIDITPRSTLTWSVSKS